jgi:hypothetical protein
MNPSVAKVGGLQSQGVKGEVVVTLPRSLYNAGSEDLRLLQRVNNKAKLIPSFEYTDGVIKKNSINSNINNSYSILKHPRLDVYTTKG